MSLAWPPRRELVHTVVWEARTVNPDARTGAPSRRRVRQRAPAAARPASRGVALVVASLGCETDPSAVVEHDIRRLPQQLHLVERRVAEPLVRDSERVEPDDPCRLAPRLPGSKRQVHFKVRAVDRVAERVEKRRVSLEG